MNFYNAVMLEGWVGIEFEQLEASSNRALRL